ncbi:hypothetical protein ACLOJK_038340 [Asimina triloba]
MRYGLGCLLLYMLMFIAWTFQVVGLGISGRAAARLALARGASVIAIDSNKHLIPLERDHPVFAGQINLRTVLGHYDGKILEDADRVIVSPGVPRENYDLSRLTRSSHVTRVILATSKNYRASLNDIEECFLRQLDEGTKDVGNDANNSSAENLAGKNICPGCCSGDNIASEVSNSDFNVESGLSISDGKCRSSSTSNEEDSGMTVEMGCVGGNSYCACYKRCDNLKRGEMVDTEGESLLGVVPSLHVGSG